LVGFGEPDGRRNRRLPDRTKTTVGSRIAILVDGRIVSAPTVQTPITSGVVVVTSGLTERQTTSLATRLGAG
jgi:preprotein translocase subunit SecD